MDKVTIADCAFLQYGKTAALGQDNISKPATYIDWQLGDPQNARFVTDGFLPLSKGEGQVAWLLEPFLMHPNNYFAVLERKFEHVLTHNKYLAENYGWLWYPFGGSYIEFDLWKVYKKTKNVSIILSQKKSMPGHVLRHWVVKEFGNLFDDILGLDTPVRKFDGLAPYRYSLVIENEKSSSWFTEKLIDCFSVGTVPIYWGCPDIGTYFNPDGIIQIECVEDIPNLIAEAKSTDYRSRLPAIRENLELARKYRIPEDWIYENYPLLFKKG